MTVQGCDPAIDLYYLQNRNGKLQIISHGESSQVLCSTQQVSINIYSSFLMSSI